MSLACGDCLDNCRYMVFTNKLSSVVDLLVYQMKVRLYVLYHEKFVEFYFAMLLTFFVGVAGRVGSRDQIYDLKPSLL